MGLQPDRPTNLLPMSDEGMVVAAGRKVLKQEDVIQRGTATFERKIQHAADAGAEFVVIYNNVMRPNSSEWRAQTTAPFLLTLSPRPTGMSWFNS